MTSSPSVYDPLTGLDVPDLRGMALTVDGPVDPATLGVALMHEHLFLDLRRPAWGRRPGEDAPEAAEPLSLKNLARTRQGGPLAANDLIGDVAEMLPEVLAFRDAGGGTIVDVTSRPIGRDPRSLRRIARASGVQVVMGAGWYSPRFHPPEMDRRTVDDLTAETVHDIVVGADGTGIRSGVIGEIGAENLPLTDNEWKITRSAARAGRITGAPLTFHCGGHGDERLRVLEAIAEEGLGADRVVFGHVNDLAVEQAAALPLLRRGATIEFDFLGTTGSRRLHRLPIGDHRVARGVAELVDAGFAGQLLLAHDVCQRIQLQQYGGQGFTYISDHFLPALRRHGVPEDAITQIMVGNPARLLAFDAPRP
ncbi:phosphotriesterase [Microbacterium sp. USTB-Y]|uniref:phosphotriesterase family protein n=1 Tax=Microbacterium sp. USTB-Y TaxID=2823692 RepID=UPI00203BFE4B|nr:aryldialkylphosphatase [Microbacterium sp. USTB-Y]